MVPNEEFSGARLIRVEYGTVEDFSVGLPYLSPFYFLLVFKKGKETMTDIWRLPEIYPDFATHLNKVVDRKEGNSKDSATYYFTEGTVIVIS